MIAARFVGFYLLLSVLQSLLAAASFVARRGEVCPLLGDCPNSDNVDDTPSLLELSATRSSSSRRLASKGCGPKYLPAHFTCQSCDEQTCKGCEKVVCDISKCIGKFYSKQCWCKLGDATEKHFCDDDCSGGLCNSPGLQCMDRDKACKPWWWCKLPPPKEPEESFLQKMSSARSAACGKQESALDLNERFEKAKARRLSLDRLQESSEVSKKAIDNFKFGTGSFVCESGFVPPPDEDPITLAESPPGFIVFDKNSCTGGYFKKKCFCYDKFLYLRGKDPKTSEFECDDSCSQGSCGGKTCATVSPPPLPPPAPPPVMDPYLQEIALQGTKQNYGVQMQVVH